MITFEELKSLKEKTLLGKQKDAAIIPSGELERIKQTINRTERKEESKQALLEKQLAQTAAKIKKQKMQNQERETRLKNQADAKPSLEQIQRAQGMLSKAQQQLDEEHDDVKDMNQKVMFSRIVTVRDK